MCVCLGVGAGVGAGAVVGMGDSMFFYVVCNCVGTKYKMSAQINKTKL